MDKTLFQDYYFIICDLNILKHIIHYLKKNRNDYISKYIIQPNEDGYYTATKLFKNYNTILELFFIKLLTRSEFNHEWKSIISIFKLQYNLITNIKVNIFQNKDVKNIFDKTNLNKFIINFIQDNFLLFKDKENITSDINQWIVTDNYKYNNTFHKNLTLFEQFNSSKLTFNHEHIDNILSSSKLIDNNLLIKFLLTKNELEKHNLIKSNFLDKYEEKFHKTYEQLYTIDSKINILQNAIDNNIKSEKPISILELADLIHQKNKFNKELINKKNNINYGILFLKNKNNLL